MALRKFDVRLFGTFIKVILTGARTLLAGFGLMALVTFPRELPLAGLQAFLLAQDVELAA